MNTKYISKSRNSFKVIIYPNQYVGSYLTIEEAVKGRDLYLASKNITLAPKSTNYVEYKDLNYEMIVSLAQGKPTKRLVDMFILTNKRVNSKFYYDNTQDREDILQFSITRLLEQWHNCDMDKNDNAFPYITEIIKRAHAFHFNELVKNRGDVSIERWGETGLGSII